MIHLCQSTFDTLRTLAIEGSHEEGILVQNDEGCYHPINSQDFFQADATYHMHGGTCEIGNIDCFLEPPSIKDLQAFNTLLGLQVDEHFIFGPTYLYHIFVKQTIPYPIIQAFEILRCKQAGKHFTRHWDRLYNKILIPYITVTRYTI